MRTADLCRKAGWRTLICPLLEIAPVPVPRELPSFDAVLLSSANALHGVDRLALNSRPPVYCIGVYTADAARNTGLFSDIHVADGDSKSLHTLLCNAPKDYRLLHLRGEDISESLQQVLSEVSQTILPLPVYSSISRAELPADIQAEIRAGRVRAVTLFSMKTADLWRSLVDAYELKAYMKAITPLCLGKSVLNSLPAQAYRDVCVLSAPEDEALESALKAL